MLPKKHKKADIQKIIKTVASLGGTNADIAAVLDIESMDAVYTKYPDLLETYEKYWTEGERIRLLNVQAALYNRATGVTVFEEKAVLPRGAMEPVIVRLEKQYPPDTEAAKFILSTRDSADWNPKTIVAHEGRVQNDMIIKYRIPDNGRYTDT